MSKLNIIFLDFSLCNIFITGNGAAMEEILFSCCPELIVAKLFTKELAENQCFVIQGFERFTNGVGYGKGFRYMEDHADNFVANNRIGIIDAVQFDRYL